jgi:hypothetical protein
MNSSFLELCLGRAKWGNSCSRFSAFWLSVLIVSDGYNQKRLNEVNVSESILPIGEFEFRAELFLKSSILSNPNFFLLDFSMKSSKSSESFSFESQKAVAESLLHFPSNLFCLSHSKMCKFHAKITIKRAINSEKYKMDFIYVQLHEYYSFINNRLKSSKRETRWILWITSSCCQRVPQFCLSENLLDRLKGFDVGSSIVCA